MRTKKRCTIALVLLLALAQVAAAAPVLNLLPDGGNLLGKPGTTIGWGFTLTNNEDYAVWIGTVFTPAGFGVFTDYSGYYDDIVHPLLIAGPTPEAATVTQAFDSPAQTGLGSFTIRRDLPLGTVIHGQIQFYYALFRVSPNDPSFDPDTDTINPGTQVLTQDVTITLANVPEPATVSLSLIILALVMPLAKRVKADRNGDRS